MNEGGRIGKEGMDGKEEGGVRGRKQWRRGENTETNHDRWAVTLKYGDVKEKTILVIPAKFNQISFEAIRLKY